MLPGCTAGLGSKETTRSPGGNTEVVEATDTFSQLTLPTLKSAFRPLTLRTASSMIRTVMDTVL